jgi:hypothetical protein
MRNADRFWVALGAAGRSRGSGFFFFLKKNTDGEGR